MIILNEAQILSDSVKRVRNKVLESKFSEFIHCTLHFGQLTSTQFIINEVKNLGYILLKYSKSSQMSIFECNGAQK